MRGHDMRGHNMRGHDMGGDDMGGGHDMSGHDMGQMLVAGLPLADVAPARDGLTLDVVHLPLGPVLTHWPAGLVVNTSVQGDVITDVAVQLWPAAPHPSPPALTGTSRAYAAWASDHAARLLDLAGWARAAAHTRAARDLLIEAEALPAEQAHQREEQARGMLTTTAARLRRSRLLRWALGDLGVLTGPHVPTRLQGDVLTRLWGWYDDAAAALSGHDSPGPPLEQGEVLTLLPGMLTGLELGAARLVVASLGWPEAEGSVADAGQSAAHPHTHQTGAEPGTGPGQPPHAQPGGDGR
jgi:hypothetical protein